jgi:plasmid stabilization system protein ParE
MANVLLSPQAEADLDEIWDYLESRNRRAALRIRRRGQRASRTDRNPPPERSLRRPRT